VTAEERIRALASLLHHPDPSQLVFQVAEIAGERTYLRHGLDVGKDSVVLDVGANVGVAAAFFAAQCGARLVHCFEPVAPLCDLLRENVGPLSACVVHEYGLSSAPGHAHITYYPHAAAMSGLYADPERDRELARAVLLAAGFSDREAEERLHGLYEAQELTCDLRTVSWFLRESQLDRVDLLKIDVERAELDVLAGIEEPDWAKIEQVVIEVHDEQGRCAHIARELSGRAFHVTVDQDAAMRGTSIRMLYATRR